MGNSALQGSSPCPRTTKFNPSACPESAGGGFCSYIGQPLLQSVEPASSRPHAARLVSVGCMDPGNWAAGLERGARFNLLDSAIAPNAAFFVKAAILVVAATTFHHLRPRRKTAGCQRPSQKILRSPRAPVKLTPPGNEATIHRGKNRPAVLPPVPESAFGPHRPRCSRYLAQIGLLKGKSWLSFASSPRRKGPSELGRLLPGLPTRE